MALVHLEIACFRNLTSTTLKPVLKGFNCIVGDNGSGKTSLLEAIYYLSLGRSFRSHLAERVVNVSATQFSLFAHLVSDAAGYDAVGLERHVDGGLKIRINANDVSSVAELARYLPVQLIDSYCHQLLDSGPSVRRKFLDWGIFYYNPEFLRTWKLFSRALKQRNAALRGQISKKELEAWTQELVLHAEVLHAMRNAYLEALIPCLEAMIARLLDFSGIKIQYQPGWDVSHDYAAVLANAVERDFQLGYTHYGPQKADLRIVIQGVPAKDILSRGQQKLFVCAMIMARGTLLERGNKRPVYLVDDLPSELDSSSRSKLLSLLAEQDAQVFVTAVDSHSLGPVITAHPVKMFHVEHGNVGEDTEVAISSLS